MLNNKLRNIDITMLYVTKINRPGYNKNVNESVTKFRIAIIDEVNFHMWKI